MYFRSDYDGRFPPKVPICLGIRIPIKPNFGIDVVKRRTTLRSPMASMLGGKNVAKTNRVHGPTSAKTVLGDSLVRWMREQQMLRKAVNGDKPLHMKTGAELFVQSGGVLSAG